MASLEIRNLSKNFGRIKALRDVSLAMDDGEFVIMLGPTGAGKTTTLRCVAGLEKLDTGDVLMGGENVTALSPAARDVALVFQSYALYPRKTVMQNMAFPLEARNMARVEIEQRVREVASKLDIGNLLNRRPAELSGGQQQRVALGRAMVRQPRIFLMDEPLTNLDFTLRVEMRAELKRLQKDLSATFFYVTNDQVEAMSMADRVAVLNEGQLQQIDTPENVYDHPANLFVASFVGSPMMNFLDCALDVSERKLVGNDGVWHMPLNADVLERLDDTANGGGQIFGIRPEDADLYRTQTDDAIPGEVYVIEPLGDRSFIDIKIGDDIVKVKMPPTFETESGATLWMKFDPERFHLFGKESGQTLL